MKAIISQEFVEKVREYSSRVECTRPAADEPTKIYKVGIALPTSTNNESFQTFVEKVFEAGLVKFSYDVTGKDSEGNVKGTPLNLTYESIMFKKERGEGSPGKLPDKVRDALAAVQNKLHIMIATGQLGKKFKAEAKGRDEATYTLAVCAGLLKKALDGVKNPKGELFLEKYADRIATMLPGIANSKPDIEESETF
jgi:hypothetical protein